MGERQVVCEGGEEEGEEKEEEKEEEEEVSARSGNRVSQEPCASFVWCSFFSPTLFQLHFLSAKPEGNSKHSLSLPHPWKSLGFFCSRFLLLIPLDESLEKLGPATSRTQAKCEGLSPCPFH